MDSAATLDLPTSVLIIGKELTLSVLIRQEQPHPHRARDATLDRAHRHACGRRQKLNGNVKHYLFRWIDFFFKFSLDFGNVKHYSDLGRSNESVGADLNSTFNIDLR